MEKKLRNSKRTRKWCHWNEKKETTPNTSSWYGKKKEWKDHPEA